MSFQHLDRGRKAQVTLFFDGSVSPNPGSAAWGAMAVFTIGNRRETRRWSSGIGVATNNVAEYLGLIGGLRRVINHLQHMDIRHTYVKLTVFGDSRVVVDQVSGAANVRSENLAPLHVLARLLLSRFLDVEVRHCSRAENADADRLANAARQAGFDDSTKAVFYPALSRLTHAWVQDSYTLASHDVLTAGSDPSFFIDASFLWNLPEGKALFRGIQDPHPLSQVIGKVHMTVLGTIPLKIGVRFSRCRSNQPDPTAAEQTAFADVVVVHSLPVPFHVSARNPAIDMPENLIAGLRAGDVRFDPENLPESYGRHPYWHSNVIFLGHEG